MSLIFLRGYAGTYMKSSVLLGVLLLPVVAYGQDFEHPHHLSLFLGGTHVLNDDHSGETIGLDYEYRVSELLGVGFVAEYAFSDVDATTLLAVADTHSDLGLILQVGPGIEFTQHHGDFLIFRVGGLYEFEFEHYTISPQFHIDIADNHGDSLVFGMAFGAHF